jgi:hypothetical protein
MCLHSSDGRFSQFSGIEYHLFCQRLGSTE